MSNVVRVGLKTNLELDREIAELELARVDVAEREAALYEQYAYVERVLEHQFPKGATDWWIKNSNRYIAVKNKLYKVLGQRRLAQLEDGRNV